MTHFQSDQKSVTFQDQVGVLLMENFSLFMRGLVASWMAWTGGILLVIPFFESIVEPYLCKIPRVKKFLESHGHKVKKNLKVIALICLFIGCYRAWFFEYTDTQTVISEKAQAVGDLGICNADLKASDATKELYEQQNQTQQAEFFTQQSDINKCVASLGKLTVPEPSRILTRGFILPTSGNDENSKVRVVILISDTNRDLTPFKGKLTCETPFRMSFLGISLGVGSYSTGSSGTLQKELPLNFPNIDWRVGDPMVAILLGDSLDPTRCSITAE